MYAEEHANRHLTGIIHGAMPTRSASEGGKTSWPRLRFGLVWRTFQRSPKGLHPSRRASWGDLLPAGLARIGKSDI